MPRGKNGRLKAQTINNNKLKELINVPKKRAPPATSGFRQRISTVKGKMSASPAIAYLHFMTNIVGKGKEYSSSAHS